MSESRRLNAKITELAKNLTNASRIEGIHSCRFVRFVAKFPHFRRAVFHESQFDDNLLMTPAVSILMPVYNAQRYLASAVQSVLDQTFSDFEFIIINDGSTDRSEAILQEFASKDPRVKIVSRPNTGLTRALNEALSLARAPLIARMDADDLSLPRRLELQVARFGADHDLVLLGGAYELIDAAGRLLTTRQAAA